MPTQGWKSLIFPVVEFGNYICSVQPTSYAKQGDMQYKYIEKKGDILATSLKQNQANVSDI